MNTTEKLLSERKLPKLPETREEMLTILEREEYGPVPPAPEEVTAEALEPEIDKCAGHAVYGHCMLRVRMPSFRVSFPIRTLLPKKYPEGGAPCFIFINFRPEVPDWYLPAEEIIDRGYGVMLPLEACMQFESNIVAPPASPSITSMPFVLASTSS